MRVTLEPLNAGHAPEMFPVLSDPAIYRYISEAPPASVEAVAERHGRQMAGKSADGRELWFNWIVRENATGKAIGYVQATVIGEMAWIAYVLAPSSHGKGLGREATEAMMRILRERNAISRFRAEADKRNAASIGLLRALGFVECPGAKEGEQRFELSMGPLETLSNMIWRAFAGSQNHLTAGTERVRRFAAGYSPLLAFAEPASADFTEIAPFCQSGERFYCGEWTGAQPPGWTIELDTTMCPMLWNGAPPAEDAALQVTRLRAEHVPQAMELTALTRPGPFGERTIELGEWYGVFEGGLLVAMAGERLQDGKLREISGICTRPEFQGRGLARRMTELMVRRLLARGETPFLHVAAKNTRAVDLYKKMGFVVTREVPMRIVTKN